MRVVVFVSREGFNKSIYDRLIQEMKTDENPPKGSLIHIATFDAKGIRVCDVWESEADFKNFQEKRLTPALKKIGFNERPTVEIYPLHALTEVPMPQRTAATR